MDHGAEKHECCPADRYQQAASLDACKARCLSRDGCNCVTFNKNNRNCYLRHNCNFDKCRADEQKDYWISSSYAGQDSEEESVCGKIQRPYDCRQAQTCAWNKKIKKCVAAAVD